MNRENASFTFLHRVEEIELNIRDGRWQSALALALTIPDICGGIAFPELVKRYRDGRIMLDRQKNPTRDVGNQYIRWFDEFAAAFFKTSADSAKPYICGERCWQLRCEYLHQNKGFLNDEDSSSVRFHLGVNCGTSVCQFDPGKENDEKNFELYNTPVLDFIQFSKPLPADKLVCVICPDYAYAKGLILILQKITKHLIFCQSVEEANSPNVTVLLTPVYPEILRSTVRKFL